MTQDFTRYKPGDSLNCRVESPEPGGYLVTLLPTGIQGFLPSQEPIELGQIVPATFICMHGQRALLGYAFMIGTTERVQLSTASDSENAFAVWADSYPRSERLKRAVDLFMPPFASLPNMINMDPGQADKLLKELEEESFTGCMKVYAQEKRSRSA